MPFLFRNGYNERKQGQRSGKQGSWARGVSTSSSGRWQEKKLVLGVELGNLPSRRREKKPKHKSSKPKDVQSTPLVSVTEPVDVQILDDPEPKDSPVHIPSVTKAHSSSLPSQQVPQNLIGNEDLAWERFGTVVIDADMVVCYNMSLKDFKHSGVHDLFKVCKLFLFFFLGIYISSC